LVHRGVDARESGGVSAAGVIGGVGNKAHQVPRRHCPAQQRGIQVPLRGLYAHLGVLEGEGKHSGGAGEHVRGLHDQHLFQPVKGLGLVGRVQHVRILEIDHLTRIERGVQVGQVDGFVGADHPARVRIGRLRVVSSAGHVCLICAGSLNV